MRTRVCLVTLLLAAFVAPLHPSPSALATEDFIASLNADPSPAMLAPADALVPERSDLGTGRGGPSRCSATANCSPYANVSCSSSSGTCVSVDRSCSAGQPGYVSCNGVTTYCPSCSACTEGSLRYVLTGECCDTSQKEKQQQKCVGGSWVPTGVYTCGGLCLY